jgi:hypothetical protein
LARLLAPTSPLRAGLIFIALGLNPWTFDYLPAARGYSMALAGEMTAIFLLSRQVFLSPGQGDERRTHLFASAAAGLSVAANYAFLFAFISLFVAYLVWLFAQRGLRAVILAAWQLAWPAALILVIICGHNAARLLANRLSGDAVTRYWAGTDNFQWMFSSLKGSLFAPPNPFIVPPHLLGILQFCSKWELVLVGLLAITAVSALVMRGRSDPRATVSLICLGAAALTFAIDVTLFELSIFRLPNARTGVMFAPLLTVGLIAPLFSPHRPKFFWLELATLGTICVLFVAGISLHSREWNYDTDIRKAVEAAGDYAKRHNITKIATTWQYVAARNFYLQYLGYPIEKLQAVKHLTPGESIYFVAPPPFSQDGIIERAGLQVIYTSPQSGIRVAVKPLDQ